jgi:hypothetical protein
MNRLLRALVMVVAVAAAPRLAHSQVSDSVLTLLERLVVAGDRSSARVLADSLVAALPENSPQLAEVFYWRAATATSAADAERDYLRITVEHSYSKRAPDALLALAQLEFARGNRGAARRRFDMLLRDYPKGKHVARASLWSGRLALEEQDYTGGCATLNNARPLVGAEDVELRNQFDYYITQCSRMPAPEPVDTVPAPDTVKAPAASGAPEFSVQVAAYTARQDATSLAANLRGRGFDVRVVGDKAPYRVRIGRYATRADALSALTRMKSTYRLNGIVVEAEPK